MVGAGPVGLTLALELARFDVPSVLVEAKREPERVGSRAIVLARHALETFERLGCAGPMLERGIVLDRARTYVRERELFCIEYPPPVAGEPPAFVNLQQTHTERALLARVDATPQVELRWGSEVGNLQQDAHGITLEAGAEELRGSYAVGCDGARSAVRRLAGIEFPGKSFRDRFLIADVRAELPFRNERRFFFDPPFNPGRQALIHPQPDGEWRIDWQVPEETAVEVERVSGRLDERIRAIVGEAPYELAWLSSYRFHQRLARTFRAGRVFLAGDAAHLMAPFGARGLNSGIEDAANLAWKLALVRSGGASDALLDSYDAERRPAGRENVAVTSATMRFMAPPTRAHRLLRDAILRGSVRSRVVRRLVNSGTFATPAVYGSGPGPVGRPAPRTAETVRQEGLFRVVRLPDQPRDRLWLLRPDGYVAGPAAARRRGTPR